MTYGKVYLEGWKSTFNYEGVSSRFEFWSFIIGSGIIYLLLLLCWWLVVTINSDYDVFIFFALSVSSISTLTFAVPVIALVVRRVYDIGYSGQWVIIAMSIPVTGVILLILYCLPSKLQDQI